MTPRTALRDRAGRWSAALQAVLPQRTLSRFMHWTTRRRWRWWTRGLIWWFVRQYRIDLNQAMHSDVNAYADFNSFFTRALRPDARPMPTDPTVVVSPVDGTLTEFGSAAHGMLVQAKGQQYSLSKLLGGVKSWADLFQGGSYATFYLSPQDYHRVHMPTRGTLRAMLYVPGRLFSVNNATTRAVAALFARNERLVAMFDSASGPLAVVLVGALCVGGLETVWAGPLAPVHGRVPRRWNYETAHPPIALGRGEEMGRFNMGSTVILLFAPGRVHWDSARLSSGTPIRVGEPIGRPSPDAAPNRPTLPDAAAGMGASFGSGASG